MPLQPFARWKIGAALVTPSSNAASMPALTSICAISRIMLRSSANPSWRIVSGEPGACKCAARGRALQPARSRRLAALADAAAAKQAAVERAVAVVLLACRLRRERAARRRADAPGRARCAFAGLRQTELGAG